jgi:hypothetical protein
MCMEDIRLGRKTGSRAYTVTLAANTVTTLANLDPNRISLTISADASHVLSVGPEGVTPAQNVGIQLTTSYTTQSFHIDRDGIIVTKPWKGFCTSITTITVLETTLEHQ